jgi:hypothetical protein
MSEQEIEITPDNFDEHFFDVRKNKPQKGQIMAKYTAIAELVDGRMKRDLIDLLLYHKRGGPTAAQVMRKLGGAGEGDSYKVVRKMAEDLAAGKSVEEVAETPYKFLLEHFFYTQKELVPKDDPHWSVIELLNFVEGTQPTALESPGQDS